MKTEATISIYSYPPFLHFPNMESALWRLEDSWKLSTRAAVALLASTVSLLFIAAAVCACWRRRRRTTVIGKVDDGVGVEDRPCTVATVLLVGSARWSEGSRWEDGGGGGGVARAVWQRPILMGEKCKLPRFSGLILYDQRGAPLPLHHHLADHPLHLQESSPLGRATEMDLL